MNDNRQENSKKYLSRRNCSPQKWYDRISESGFGRNSSHLQHMHIKMTDKKIVKKRDIFSYTGKCLGSNGPKIKHRL
jgi:hypothetical protein